jgi:hypothetical protein
VSTKAAPEVQVLLAVRDWAGKARAGKVRWGSLVGTPIRPGERLNAIVHSVIVREVPPGTSADLDERAWHRSDQRSLNAAVAATDRRLLAAGNRKKVLAEWPWEQIAWVRMATNMRALLVKGTDEDRPMTAVMREQYMLLSSPKAVEVAAQLICLEGAWFMWQGRLDEWVAALPGRLGGAAAAHSI